MSTGPRSFKPFLPMVMPKILHVRMRQSPYRKGEEGWGKWTDLSWDVVSWNIHVTSSPGEGSMFRVDHSQGVQGGQECPPQLHLLGLPRGDVDFMLTHMADSLPPSTQLP